MNYFRNGNTWMNDNPTQADTVTEKNFTHRTETSKVKAGTTKIGKRPPYLTGWQQRLSQRLNQQIGTPADLPDADWD